MTNVWDDLSTELARPITEEQSLRHAWGDLCAKLARWREEHINEDYNASNRAELDAYIGRVGVAIEEVIARREADGTAGRPAPEDWYVGVSAAAELTGYSVASIRRLCADGTIRAHKVGTDWWMLRGQLATLTRQKPGPKRSKNGEVQQ